APARPSTVPHAGRPLRALVTVGPTHEPIDEVRYLGNRSSGRLGMAIAESLAAEGCTVTVLAGPGVTATGGLATERFVTTADLGRLLDRHWPTHDLLVMAAAVADYRPARTASGKMRREDGPVTLALEPTPDLLAGLASRTGPGRFIVGFALERPEELEATARRKLARKGVDAIVANPIDTMDADDVEATLFLRDGSMRSPGPGRLPTRAFARWLARTVVPMAADRPAARA
ncbi:MAG: phosphopantothenoylcysteine decarboxylase, partial [Phycisphaerales bacterium]